MTGEFAIAVHALVYLNHKGSQQSSEALAENICTNPARVRKIMTLLTKDGLVSTHKGGSGGYMFTLKPSEVTLARIARAVDAKFVFSPWKPGESDMECLIASGMAEIMDDIYGELDGLCKARLESTTIADIDRRVFGGVSV